MSVQALNELYIELNRITIAGVNLAKGDYRINKLVPIFKKSGESAPVFNKVASLTERLTSDDEVNRSGVLLECLNLVIAILSTLGKTGITGEMTLINGSNQETATTVSYRKLKPVIDALKVGGSGRLAVINQAYEENLYSDFRTIGPLIHALSDSYAEVNEFAMNRLYELGELVIPVIKETFDMKDSKSSRKVQLIAKIAKERENEWYKSLLNDESHEEVLIEAIQALRYDESNLDVVLEYTLHKKKAIRQASFNALGFFYDIEATNAFYKAFDKKDRDIIKEGIRNHQSNELIDYIIDQVKETFNRLLKSDKLKEANNQKKLPYSDKDVSLLFDGLDILSVKQYPKIIELYQFLTPFTNEFSLLEAPKSSIYNTIMDLLADSLLLNESPETLKLLKNFNGVYLKYAFVASVVLDEPKEVYQNFYKIVKKGTTDPQALPIIDLFYYLATNSGSQSTQVLLNVLRQSLKELDERWLDVFIELDNYQVVLFLAHGNSKKIADYLMNKAKLYVERNYSPWDAVKTLVNIEYKHAHKFILEITEAILKKQNSYIRIELDLLNTLPGKYAKELEKMGLKYGKTELVEIANNLKN